MPGPGIKYPPNQSPLSPQEWGGGRPMLFTIAQYGGIEPLYDLALALYVNPETFDESMTKSKSVAMTYGGFVEFVWPDELDTVSGSGSTGAFISPSNGLTAAPSKNPGQYGALTGRQGTLAYERYLDFLELFRSNGMIFDGNGVPAIRGSIIMMYDRGAYRGHFTTFEVAEEENSPFRFNLTWEFKVENTIYKLGRF